MAPSLLSEMFTVQDQCQREMQIQYTMSYVEFLGPQICDLFVQGGSKPSKLDRHVLKVRITKLVFTCLYLSIVYTRFRLEGCNEFMNEWK